MRKIGFVNYVAGTKETLEQLKERIGEEEYKKRIIAAQNKAMAAVGYFPAK